MLEAKKRGYSLPPNLIDRWKKAQAKTARSWQMTQPGNRYYYRNNHLVQAYRLYTLALANAPEWGAMNRMLEMKKVSKEAKWRLAAAYAIGGKKDVAQKIVDQLDMQVEAYTELSRSYGSSLRDQAMILETLDLLGNKSEAGTMVRTISDQLSKNRWYGTNTVSYCLLAVGKFVGETKVGDQFNFTYQLGNQQSVDGGSSSPIMQIKIPMDASSIRNFSVTNKGKNILFARFIRSGQPVVGDQKASQNNLAMVVEYKGMDGKKIDPTNIRQGTDFIAEVKINNPGKRGIDYEEMALSQIFPSGWEIHNSRMDGIQAFTNTTAPEYQDIRDDRVYTYFDIRRSKQQIYRVQLNAAYQGRFYLPTTYCEAMYDNSINAKQPGIWVNVVPAENM